MQNYIKNINQIHIFLHNIVYSNQDGKKKKKKKKDEDEDDDLGTHSLSNS